MNINPPIHPGEHLAEFLDELGISQSRLAEAIGASESRVKEIVDSKEPMTADMALRIGTAFGTTPEFWMNLQRIYDLEIARASVDTSKIKSLVEPEHLLRMSAGV